MDPGRGVHQSYVQVPAGHRQFFLYLQLHISINCILTFQAGLVVNEVHFKVEAPDDKPEPLAMEHFHFPLGLWLAGLVISLLCLLAEIINKYRENQQ